MSGRKPVSTGTLLLIVWLILVAILIIATMEKLTN